MALALAVITIASAAVTVVGWLGFTGRLPRNRWAGIRTGYTMSTDTRWAAAHRAGGPFLVLGGVAATAAGMAFLPFSLAGKVPAALEASVVIGCAVVLVLAALASWLIGTSSARSAEA